MLPDSRQQFTHLCVPDRCSTVPNAHLQRGRGHGLTELSADKHKDGKSKGVLFCSSPLFLHAVKPHRPPHVDEVLHRQRDDVLLSQSHTDISPPNAEDAAHLETHHTAVRKTKTKAVIKGAGFVPPEAFCGPKHLLLLPPWRPGSPYPEKPGSWHPHTEFGWHPPDES